MEIIISLILVPLLIVAVCNLIGLKAKTTAVVTVLATLAFIVVIALTVDLSPVIDGIVTWATTLSKELVKGVTESK